ncbi:MATE family efflux transporter [Maridesulfovibrio hydrothermalis]|uniref:Multidrug-efflux transporter n=1 Tax=Maridesulfovibrio hydrothermalis AM13 = DSM 14728 TaxID=1121451 RepID=L0RF19_9BACT|nr:MATE family efflux transporter [Maridesulfovibrio hydrothermalis]CCO24795.1 MATE efflux family protein [Maridesulfovibrio hydrothermalis AM13 = DSM 14728]
MNMTTASMTNSPYKTIWNLSWPQILMMMFHLMIGLVDVWVASKLGREIQASMGMISQSLFFFLVIAVATANGAVAAISQSIGAGRTLRTKRYVGLCFILGATLGSLILVLGFPFRNGILTLLQVPDEMRYVMEYFLEIFLYMLPLYYMLIITNAIFRAQKKVMLPLYSMIIVTVLNTIGDLGLGLGMWGFPDMGYKGLAWATLFSVSAGALFNIGVLYKSGYLRRKCMPPIKWVKKAFPYLFKVAGPSGLMQLVWHSGYLVLYSITASLPEGNVIALAGMTAGIRIESILFLPAFAFNMTASIIIGHYLGDGRPEEAKKFGYRILFLAIAFLGITALGLWQIIEPVTAIIAPEQVVLDEAVNYLFFNMLAIPFTLTSMIMAGALNGAGATVYNLIIFSITIWGFRLPLAYLLGHQVLESATGIWVAMLLSQGLQAAMIFYTFSCLNWQKFSMIKNKKRKINE